MARPNHRDGLLDRTAAILTVLALADSALRVEDIAHAAGLPTSSAYRIIADMVRLGWIQRTDGRCMIGPKLLEFSSGTPVRRTVHEAALPYILELAQLTRETVKLGTMEGHEVLCFAKAQGRRSTPEGVRVGSRLPAHSTALGKCLLAHAQGDIVASVYELDLPRFTASTICDPDQLAQELSCVSSRGFAFDGGETNAEIECVASPIFDRHGRAVAALSVAAPRARGRLDDARGHLRRLSGRISRSLSGAYR